jgi:hypothetical protein
MQAAEPCPGRDAAFFMPLRKGCALRCRPGHEYHPGTSTVVSTGSAPPRMRISRTG